LLRDFAAGRMRTMYQDDEPFDPSLIPSPDRSGIHPRDYLGWGTVEMSRGCPNECEFCVSHRFHDGYLRRPIGDVIEEVQALRSKVVFFLDPNLIGDREHAKAFFSELAGLKKWWVGCASLDIVDDPELLDLAAASGCRGLLMGFESLRRAALESARKTNNVDKQYGEVIDALHRRGILVQACFVFGFDTDDASVFEETADFIVKARFDLPQISVYTPFPGTPVFDRMEQEGRIITRDWSRYNGQNVVFEPRKMTVRELERGTDYVRRRAHSFGALSSRLLCRPLWIKPFVLLSYLGFRYYQHQVARLGGERVAVET
jgi:radical SAM superfamily enzyme YgiQ (UPF0313 family)